MNSPICDAGIERRFQNIKQQLDASEESPAATLGILGESKHEEHWESLLVYFLDSDNRYTLGTTILEAFLNAIASRHDLRYAGCYGRP